MIIPKMNYVLALTIIFTIFIAFPVSSEVPSYGLEQGGKIVALIEGKFGWTILRDNKTEHIVLPPKNVVVRGNQQMSKTVFVLSWSDTTEGEDGLLKKKGAPKNYTWVLSFVKNVLLPDIRLSDSSLQIGNTSKSMWVIDEPLVKDPKEAYECSSLTKMNSQNDTITMENVRLQPFDLQNETFGKSHVCDKDIITTTTVPTTTPSPAKLTTGNWTVTDNDFTCIRLIADISLKIDYHTKNGSNATAIIQVPTKAIVSPKNSTCNYNQATGKITGEEQIIQLHFKVDSVPWYLTLNFTNSTVLAHDTADHNPVVVYYARLQGQIDNQTFPNASSLGENFDAFNTVNKTSGDGALSMFKSDADHFYRCNAQEKNTVTKGFEIWTKNLRAEAFLPNRTTLLSERVCLIDQQNETSDLVPIITGACLAALVLFVLIAYLIGRARARANTYETI